MKALLIHRFQTKGLGVWTGPIPKVRACVQFFTKKKKAKCLKILAKINKIWKYFEKGQPPACDYCMQETARICSDEFAVLSNT